MVHLYIYITVISLFSAGLHLHQQMCSCTQLAQVVRVFYNLDSGHLGRKLRNPRCVIPSYTAWLIKGFPAHG